MSVDSEKKAKASTGNPAKKLTFISIFFLGINGIIGSGAFLLPQEIYKDMGMMSILVLIVAAITVSMIALCYADLGSRFSKSGAAWLYCYNAFGKFTGFQIGLFTWFLGVATLSGEAVALLKTLKNIFPVFNHDYVYYGTVMGLIVLLGIINLFGTKFVKWVDNLSSSIKIATIIFFVLVGAFFIKGANFTPIVPSNVTSASSFMNSFGQAFSVVFYLFSGFSFLPVAAAQMENPKKNIPKALISVMITVTALYILIQFIAIGILGSNIVKFDAPIAQAMGEAIGSWGYYIVISGMLISIFGLAFAVSFNTPTLAESLVNEHKLLPAFIGKKNRFGAPYVAIILTVVISCGLATGDYIFLVTCSVLAAFIQYVPTILAVIKFKYTKQFPNQGFALKGGYTIPVLALISSAYLLTNFTPTTLLIMAGVFLIGVLIYYTTVKKHGDSPTVLASRNISSSGVSVEDDTHKEKTTKTINRK